MSRWIVLKFGGTSVSSLKSWLTIKDICLERLKKDYKVFVVCSALSEASNKLSNLYDCSLAGDYENQLNDFVNIYLNFSAELNLDGSKILLDEISELNKICLGLSLLKDGHDKVRARLLALGEIMLTKLSCQWLSTVDLSCQWLDSRKYLKALTTTSLKSKNYLTVTCDATYDQTFVNYLEDHKIDLFLSQGFIASNDENETVLLGRGGSDTSGAYYASKLGAEKLEIWTDVPGLFTADPSLIPSSRLLLHVDYDEAQELASSGAKVLHPRSVEPLRLSNIPLNIKWTNRPSFNGTLIDNYGSSSSRYLKGILVKNNIHMISMESIGMWQEVGFLAEIFSIFKKHDISIDLIATSQTNVTVTLDLISNPSSEKNLRFLIKDLSKICNTKLKNACSVISLVGKNIRGILHELGPTFKAFKQKQIFMIAQSSGDLNLSIVVSEESSNSIVKDLHELCCNNIDYDKDIGPSWESLFDSSLMNLSLNKQYWWLAEKEKLHNLLKTKSSPLFVYSQKELSRVLERVIKLKNIARLNYAIKANSHPQILKMFYEEGLSFDCVSLAEVNHIVKYVQKCDLSRVVFTPNFAPISEYEKALDLGCYVTVDNLYLLEQHPDIFSGKDIFLRVDPGKGRGHHDFVETAGVKSKFGIAFSDLEKVKILVAQHDINVCGLHAHVGSGIKDLETWGELAFFLAKLANDFPKVKILDIGGGLPVPEKIGESSFDIDGLCTVLLNFKKLFPEFEIWLEPGRYLVAEAGVLLTRVTQLKTKEHRHYVGVDTGMNSLIRHPLYGAFHEIVNLDRLESKHYFYADVVGPICETGDVFGKGRKVPDLTREGDTLLLLNAGAYGRSMSSHYNMRPPAEEIFLV